MITKITSHVNAALANMLSRYEDATILRELLSSCVTPLQDLEDTLYDCIVSRLLDTAEGVNLDQYGALVGAARRGLSDADYRRYIRVRIMANRSNGQADVIIDIAAYITNAAVKYYLMAPAEYLLQFTDGFALSSDLVTLLGELLEQTTGAGIGYTVVQNYMGGKQFDTANRGFDEPKFGSTIIQSP